MLGKLEGKGRENEGLEVLSPVILLWFMDGHSIE